jgi:endonuclease/exonuclease/phosphatase family metal-dependent hydrolase
MKITNWPNKLATISCVYLLAALSVAQPALGRTLRVLTYNIHHSEGSDFVFDLNRIASTIITANPDLVALQELDQGNTRSGVSVFELNQLASLTGMQGYFGKTINFASGEYGNGILVRSDITIGTIVNHPMPSPAGFEARAVIEASLSFAGLNSTQEFTFFATHFDNSSETNRNAQAAYVNGLVAGSAKPAILAGDLNSRPSSPPFQSILGQWSDTTDLVNSGENRNSQIDYVLDRSSGQWNVITTGDFIVNATTQVASDHFPLLGVIELSESVPEPTSLSMLLIGAAGMPARRRHGACGRMHKVLGFNFRSRCL